jgi:hypothetical protein
MSASSEAKDVKRPGDGRAKAVGGAKEELGVVKDKPFDEAHSIGDESGDLSSEESVMTNESEPKTRAPSSAATPVVRTANVAASVASTSAIQSNSGAMTAKNVVQGASPVNCMYACNLLSVRVLQPSTPDARLKIVGPRRSPRPPKPLQLPQQPTNRPEAKRPTKTTKIDPPAGWWVRTIQTTSSSFP